VQIIKTKFKDLFFYKRDTFHDNRGYFKELYIEKKIKKKFCFDYLSTSKKNVIRGLHIQTKKPQGKLITVLNGKIFDAVIDCRKKSKTFGKIFTTEMSADKNISLYIPEGFAHGFCSLKDNTILHYKCTEYRDEKSETGIIWNDNYLKIKWPVLKPILSKKDKKNVEFKKINF